MTGHLPDGSGKWKPIRFLLGDWSGEGTGFGRRSSVLHTYEFILQEQFIHSRTIAKFEPESRDAEGEVHEDWGFFSYDPQRQTIVFREFLSEGYVNAHFLETVEPPTDTLVFSSESCEGAGGMRVRLTIRVTGQDEYEMALELAQPEGEFDTCQTVTMKRVK